MVDPHERLLRSAIECELNTWGRWHEKHWEYQGYPGMEAVAAMLMGSGGGSPGHKILCLEMPYDVYATHGRVIRLPDGQQEAIWMYYAVRVKPDGTLWTFTERCVVLGIKPESMSRNLRRAHRAIMGLPEKESCESVRSAVQSVAV